MKSIQGLLTWSSSAVCLFLVALLPRMSIQAAVMSNDRHTLKSTVYEESDLRWPTTSTTQGPTEGLTERDEISTTEEWSWWRTTTYERPTEGLPEPTEGLTERDDEIVTEITTIIIRDPPTKRPPGWLSQLVSFVDFRNYGSFTINIDTERRH